MTSLHEKQTIVIYILPNISRSKGNQAMTFGQLIEYNVRNFFFLKNVEANAVRNKARPGSH